MKPYLILAVIVLAGVLPFLSRGVSMDEHIFLTVAQHAHQSWLFPQDVPWLFFGIPYPNLAGNTHPPVGEYYLAIVWKLVGHFSEIPFRLSYSVFSIAAVLAFFFLARRFTEEPFHVALLFAWSPAFFVMSPTLMMDIPMLAFILCGFALYVAHLEGRPHLLLPAAICFVLAAGTGYTSLVPMAALFLMLVGGRRPWKEFAIVFAAPLALILWQAAISLHFGSIPFVKTLAFYRNEGGIARHLTAQNIAATLSFLGGVTLCPGTILLVIDRPRRRGLILSLAIAVIAAALVPAPSLWVRVWFGLLATAGLLALRGFAESARSIIAEGRNRGEAVFIVWVPATLLFFIVVADMINARYMLLALPALYLVLLRTSTRQQIVAALVPTALLSIALAYADFTFVTMYRKWVDETVPELQQEGFRLWNASESGLRFYLERQGLSSLSSTDTRPLGADLVVQHKFFEYGLSPDLGVMLMRLKTFTLNTGFPIRTFNWEAGAGFHDSRVGIVPFTFSTVPLDTLWISQVSPLVVSLPQIGTPVDDVPAWSPEGPILKQSVDRREFKLRIPANSKLEYDLVGRGEVETFNDGFVLKRLSPETIVWRRFRIVPSQFE